MQVSYGWWQDGWEEKAGISRRIAAESATVCEIGAGASPLLAPRPGYTLIDVDAEEIAKAGGGYDAIIADLCAFDFEPPTRFDFVFSHSTAEHIPDPRAFHENIRRLLRPDGIALHFFSTLYAFPFAANRLLPERLSQNILLRIGPTRAREGAQAKFPAYYRWCRGPTVRQKRRLEGCGFAISDYKGYFGHNYYRHVPPLESVATKLWRSLVDHPVPAMTSFGLVVMRPA